jgi:hypothetical protein
MKPAADAVSAPAGQTSPSAAKTNLSYASVSRDGHGTVKFDELKKKE